MAPWASYPPTMNYAAQTVSATVATVGAIWSCNDCIPGSSPAVGGGTGCLAYGNGATWNCLSPGIVGSGTTNHYGMWTGPGQQGTSGVYESAGVLYTPSGIISASGIKSTGFNPGSATGATLNIGLFLSGGVPYFYNTSIGTGSLYPTIVVQGGVITGLQ